MVFDYRQPDLSGTDAASGGYVKVQPFPQVERSKPGYRLIPEQLMGRLVEGVAQIPLECTDTYTAGCWLVESPLGVTRFITVPAGAGSITADACPDVDPATFAVIDPAPSVGETLVSLQAQIDGLGSGAGTVTSVNGVDPVDGAVTITKSDVGLDQVDNTSDDAKPISAAQAVVNAVKADLVAGKIPASQIPDIAISEYLGTAASQAAMLALTGQKGDWAIRTDTGLTWIITGTDPTLLASWTSLSYPGAPVVSINGQTGAITIEALVVAATSKTTPIDADVLPLVDSAASNVLKKLTWASLKATLKTYFDTLYLTAAGLLTALAGQLTALATGLVPVTAMTFAAASALGSRPDVPGIIVVVGGSVITDTKPSWMAANDIWIATTS